MPTKKPRISITLEPETYRQISNMAKKENKDLSVIGRELIEDALNAEVCQENLDFLSTIIREQLSAIMHLYMEHDLRLLSKTCMQAGTAAYLCAETLSRFVPDGKRLDFAAAYEKAQKKSLAYLKTQFPIDLEE